MDREANRAAWKAVTTFFLFMLMLVVSAVVGIGIAKLLPLMPGL